MKADLVDKLIQYALLCAGEEDDFFDRKLGPIHLLKYVYLADVHYAAKHGCTFTSASWRFHNFGPWSPAVHERIEAAVARIQAQKDEYPSSYSDDDFVRWNARDEHLLRQLERDLPAVITLHLKREVHWFTNSTPELLDYVYKTAPMLRAAPREHLEFTTQERVAFDVEELVPQRFSNKKLKKFKSGIEDLRQKFHASKQDKPRLVKPTRSPRYDEVFFEGTRALDELAGNPIPEGDITLQFSDEVWKSGIRDPNEFA